jgi:acetoin utilization deacetylase AcuC-like enzyme
MASLLTAAIIRDARGVPISENGQMSVAAVHHPGYTYDLPVTHPFPMAKFRILREQLNAFGDRLQWHEPAIARAAVLERVHSPGYLQALFEGSLSRAAQRRSGFPWSHELVRRVRLETGGTLLTTQLALDRGIAVNAAGGTHHAHADAASGYCLLNDLAVAAVDLLDRGAVERLLIVDLDVHQGDGTARLLADEPNAFTFSMHAARNFPARKASSDLDIGLESGIGDAAYLDRIEATLPGLIDRLQPDLIVYDAGVDVHEADRLGHCCLSDAGLYARDFSVLAAARSRGRPIAAVIGGGYDRDLDALCHRHAQLFQAATDVEDTYG